jgi:hypothetical protein
MPKPLIFLLIGVGWCVAAYNFGYSWLAYVPGAIVAIGSLIAGGVWNSDGDRSGRGPWGDSS